MNKLERLTAILLLLQDKPRTSEEIARRFEVSKRTILRDIQALSETPAERLEAALTARGETVTGRWAVLHALEHTALHLGHLQLTAQLWRAPAAGG